MKAVRVVAKNTVVLLLADIASRALRFFFIIYIARYLGVEDFGTISFALAFGYIFSVLADMGLSILLVREVAKDRSAEGRYLGNVATLKLCLGFLFFLSIVVAINLMGYPSQTKVVVYLIAGYIYCCSFTDTFSSIFRANERMEFQSVSILLDSGLLLLGTLFAISRGYGVVAFAFVYLAVGIIVLLYSIIVCAWKFSFPRIRFEFSFWKRCLSEAWPIGVLSVCVMFNFRLDSVMLSMIKGEEAVGFYSAAYKLSEAATVIPSVFALAIFPVLSKFYASDRERFTDVINKSIKYLLSMALPMALIITFLSRQIIEFVYSGKYSESIPALQILIWASATMYITMLLGSAFITAYKQITQMVLAIISVLVNFVLNIILIPGFGYNGAAAATLISEVYGLIVGLILLRKFGYRLLYRDSFLIPLSGICIAATISVPLLLADLNIILVLSVAFIAYVAFMLVFGLREGDKELIGDLIGRRKRG